MAADQNNGKQTDIIQSDFDCNSASKFSKAWTEDLSNLKGQFSVINGAITELKLCLKEDIKQIEDQWGYYFCCWGKSFIYYEHYSNTRNSVWNEPFEKRMPSIKKREWRIKKTE